MSAAAAGEEVCEETEMGTLPSLPMFAIQSDSAINDEQAAPEQVQLEEPQVQGQVAIDAFACTTEGPSLDPLDS